MLYQEDCIQKLKDLGENTVGCSITDPPYFLSDENTFNTHDLLSKGSMQGRGFMNQEWDGGTVEVVETDSTPISSVSKPVKWIKVNGHFIEPENIRQLKSGTHQEPVYKQRLNVYYEFCKLWGKELLRVLKPGAHVAAFSGTRTYHSMTQALEDVGFDIRDSMHWIFGNGFPKNHNISLAFDKSEDNEREVIGIDEKAKNRTPGSYQGIGGSGFNGQSGEITKPEGENAKKWEGYGTALKPAHEPIVIARKPLDGTYIENIVKYGVGAINIDDARIPTEDSLSGGGITRNVKFSSNDGWNRPWMDDEEHVKRHSEKVAKKVEKVEYLGRYPANVIFDEEMANELDKQTDSSPPLEMSSGDERGGSRFFKKIEWKDSDNPFFYCSKSSKSERNIIEKNRHPTVKPVRLMWYLITLFCPPGEIVIDPFMGSGTTGMAAVVEERPFIGIEYSKDHFELSKKRIDYVKSNPKEIINDYVNDGDTEPKKKYEVSHNFW